jgi:hypothetical protein
MAAEYGAEQPTDASYVTKGRAIPQVPTNIREDAIWARPLPACSTLPALLLREVVVADDYLGACPEGRRCRAHGARLIAVCGSVGTLGCCGGRRSHPSPRRMSMWPS